MAVDGVEKAGALVEEGVGKVKEVIPKDGEEAK